MRKYLALMFTVFYFGFSSGMVYNVHYCLDKIFVSAASSGETCDLCGGKTKNDCCKSETKVLKTDAAKSSDISFISDFHFVATIPEIFYAEFLIPNLERNQFSIYSHAPPDIVGPHLFLTYCNFRI